MRSEPGPCSVVVTTGFRGSDTSMTLMPVPVVATNAQCPAQAMLAEAPGSAVWPTSASPQL